MKILAWIVSVVVLFFVIRALRDQFRAVDWSTVHFRPIPAALAVACLFAVSAMQLLARWALLRAYGYPLSWRIQFRVTWVAQIGKYIPGGIASVGGAMLMLRKHGVPAAVSLSTAVLLDGLAVLAGMIASTPLLLWEPVRRRAPLAWMICIVLTVGGIAMLHPRIFVGMVNWLLKKVRRQPIEQVPGLGTYLVPVLASFGQWIFAGLALWLMTASVTDAPPRLIPLFTASAALAMTVSYLAPFSPGGLGIREGLYLITLGPLIGPSVAIVAVAMRIAQTLIEILFACVGLWMMRNPV
jgi:uncharacterized membrane protein YbhN (UPF0104 family)